MGLPAVELGHADAAQHLADAHALIGQGQARRSSSMRLTMTLASGRTPKTPDSDQSGSGVLDQQGVDDGDLQRGRPKGCALSVTSKLLRVVATRSSPRRYSSLRPLPSAGYIPRPTGGIDSSQ